MAHQTFFNMHLRSKYSCDKNAIKELILFLFMNPFLRFLDDTNISMNSFEYLICADILELDFMLQIYTPQTKICFSPLENNEYR